MAPHLASPRSLPSLGPEPTFTHLHGPGGQSEPWTALGDLRDHVPPTQLLYTGETEAREMKGAVEGHMAVRDHPGDRIQVARPVV